MTTESRDFPIGSKSKNYRLTAHPIGESDKRDGFFKILVQTYEWPAGNVECQTNVSFLIDCSGQDPVLVDKNIEGFKGGVYLVKIKMKVGQKQKVRFHIMGIDATTEEITIPALQYERGLGVDQTVGLWENFLRGLGFDIRREDPKDNHGK